MVVDPGGFMMAKSRFVTVDTNHRLDLDFNAKSRTRRVRQQVIQLLSFACATMKLTTTTVKVCSTELNDSRSKESVTDVCREAAPESTTEVRTG
jgi:hypothetical protein